MRQRKVYASHRRTLVLQEPERRSPAHLVNDLRNPGAKRPPWSAPVDNSNLSPLETLQEIARIVEAGEGELRGPIPNHAVGEQIGH